MKQHLYVLLLLIPGICSGLERFRLVSELRTNYGQGAQPTFTQYHYDAGGNRIDKRIFGGVDSTAALKSRIAYSYDAERHCIEELLLSAGGDTLSIVRYVYGSDGLTSASTRNKDGTVRFRDSLLYAGGVLTEQRRYNAANTMTFYHHYAYTGGRLSRDTLYEPDGGTGFTATQARVIDHNAGGTVAAEAQWRCTGGQWYCISTTVMAYKANGNLLSATTYETDGASKRLIDSLAYAGDAHGNRVKEEHFDKERVKTHDIVYTWLDMQPATLAGTSREYFSPVWRGGYIEFGMPLSGTITLCRADGRRVYERRIEFKSTAVVPAGLGAGRYVVVLRGTKSLSLPITIYN